MRPKVCPSHHDRPVSTGTLPFHISMMTKPSKCSGFISLTADQRRDRPRPTWLGSPISLLPNYTQLPARLCRLLIVQLWDLPRVNLILRHVNTENRLGSGLGQCSVRRSRPNATDCDQCMFRIEIRKYWDSFHLFCTTR
jgi:hypothetical protein